MKQAFALLLFAGLLNANNGPQQFNKLSSFIENKGQVYGYDGLTHPEVKFVSDRGNMSVFLFDHGLAYQFVKIPPGEDRSFIKGSPSSKQAEWQQATKAMVETYRIDMTLEGASPFTEITATGKSEDYFNYPLQETNGVRSYETVTYHDVYPGIDWVVKFENGGLKYDFLVSPGADPSLIKMKFSHQRDLRLDASGNLVIGSSLGNVVDGSPLALQAGQKINSQFKIFGSTVSFVIGQYDRSQSLVIDPNVEWSTYYGSSAADEGYGIATDASGDVYFCGETLSGSAIAAGGYQNNYAGNKDGFLAKFSSAGVRIWATYYGKSGLETCRGMCIDASGDVYIAGTTAALSGMGVSGHQNSFGGGNTDGYLAKFTPAGTLIWSTYYGGNGTDYGAVCATDAAGNVYFSGDTQSTNNIAAGGHQNTFSPGTGGIWANFLVKFSSAGVRQWGTYYGNVQQTYNSSVATDSQGNVYIGGETNAATGIASGGHQNTLGSGVGSNDGFLVKFDASGVRQWATYYGGSSFDNVYGISCDSQDNVIIAGASLSSNNIATPGTYQPTIAGAWDAFVSKFTSGGNRIWGTYFGAFDTDIGNHCVVDAADKIYVAGYTDSQTSEADVILYCFDQGGQWLYFDGIGGPLNDFGTCVAVASDGSTYLTGSTQSNAGFGVTGHQNNLGGNYDAFLVKFGCTELQFTLDADKTQICKGEIVALSGNGGNFDYSWSTGQSGQQIMVGPATNTTYVLTATAQDGCSSSATVNIFVAECVSLKEVQAAQVNVFPNPSNDEINLYCSEDTEAELISATGKVVFRKAFHKGMNTCDVSACASGIYFLRLDGEGKVHKVVIQGKE
jgi:hypothetical protein